MSSDDTSLRRSYEDVLKQGNLNQNNIQYWLEQLQQLVLDKGLPLETENERKVLIGEKSRYNGESSGGCSLRGRIWKAFLRIRVIDANYYINLIDKGPSEKTSEIDNDVFRTFASDQEFKKRVSDEKLKRVLNAFVHSYGGDTSDFAFFQGMSLIASPFLFIMNEVDSFYAYKRLMTRICPTYFTHEMVGTYAGCALVDEILQIIDPQLHAICPESRSWAFKYISSFLTNQKPLREVLKLWDFFLAFGFHFNVVCTVAQAVILRDELLSLNERSKVHLKLQAMDQHLNASLVISVATYLVAQIPEWNYNRLMVHTHNLVMAKEISTQSKTKRPQQMVLPPQPLSPLPITKKADSKPRSHSIAVTKMREHAQ